MNDSQPRSSRNLVFISHAYPEDNGFTVWLAARLAANGYEVWSDVTKLIGGEVIWDQVEDAIRTHAAKVLCVVSQASIKKKGVRKEVTLADLVESREGLKNFLIPCRIDAVDYGDMSVHLLPKLAVDFTNGWHLGLAQVLKRLTTDRVPQSDAEHSQAVSGWTESFLKIADGVGPRIDHLLSNWLPITSFPTSIYCSEVTEAKPDLSAAKWPVARYAPGCLCSFASTEQLGIRRSSVRRESQISVDDFLANGKDSANITAQTANNAMVDLTKQAWSRLCSEAGLVPYELANHRQSWFLPLVASSAKKISFTGLDGAPRKKGLIGYSAKYQVHWHAGIEASPVLAATPRVSLMQHVIFTVDGVKPLADAAKMHRLRRSFCKQWWQAQWRDLQLAFLAYLQGRGDLSVTVSPAASFQWADRAIDMVASVALLNEGIESTVLADEDPPEGEDDESRDFWDDDESLPNDPEAEV